MISIKRLYDYLNRDERLLTHLSAVLVTGFLLLTLLVYLSSPSIIDIEVSEEVQEERGPLRDGVMRLVSWFGNGFVPVILTAITSLAFFLVRAKREAVFILLTSLSGVVIYVLKIAVNRPRPTADLVTIIEHAQFQSFPSGHVTFYVVFFGFLTFLMYRLNWIRTGLRWSIGLISLALIFSVPFSRVYLGAHWFTDVLAGFFVGQLCLIGLARWYVSGKKATDVPVSNLSPK
jgi:undecaprenyl-diphosphatase